MVATVGAAVVGAVVGAAVIGAVVGAAVGATVVEAAVVATSFSDDGAYPCDAAGVVDAVLVVAG